MNKVLKFASPKKGGHREIAKTVDMTATYFDDGTYCISATIDPPLENMDDNLAVAREVRGAVHRMEQDDDDPEAFYFLGEVRFYTSDVDFRRLITIYEDPDAGDLPWPQRWWYIKRLLGAAWVVFNWGSREKTEL
ncbi:hypothetical protein KAR91_51870 [Candidatus Pacearchaeota archaeon]|nr:hypothetical protein [Candidatus Pacearchaeota archaeon]